MLGRLQSSGILTFNTQRLNLTRSNILLHTYGVGTSIHDHITCIRPGTRAASGLKLTGQRSAIGRISVGEEVSGTRICGKSQHRGA